jgi:hypothetical protein
VKLFQDIGEDHAMHNYRLSLGDVIRWRRQQVRIRVKIRIRIRVE